MRFKWGTGDWKTVTGAHLAVGVYQVASLLPLLYILGFVGYPAIITSKNLLSFLFDIGIMTLPRAEALGLSALYSATANETLVYFAILVPALVVGLVFNKLLREDSPACITARKALAVLIACDLLLRVLPFGFNLAFGLPAAIIGWLAQAACLAFVILDLRAIKE